MIIRAWEKRDIDAIAQIEAFSFQDPWTKSNLLDVLKYPHYKSFLLEEQEQVCAYGCLILVFDRAEVANIAVATPYRGRGLGRLLLDRMHYTAKTLGATECFLEVRVSNVRAIGLYESCGYERYGIRARYYGNEDAILMRKTL